MSERYTELYRLPSRYCLEGCPLYIEAGTLLKDTETDRVLVQLKICNLSINKVTSCKVTINSFEPNGNFLESVNHQYLDLNVAMGGYFGAQEAIFLSINNARRYDVCITEAVFDNGEVWSSDETKWNELDTPQKISDYYSDQELTEQFYIEAGRQAIYVPRTIYGLYQCSCGTLNENTAQRCRFCKKEYDFYNQLLSIDYLKNRVSERKEQELKREEEKRIREEEERRKKEEEKKAAELEALRAAEDKKMRQEQKKKKTKIILFVSIPVLFVIIVIAVVVGYNAHRLSLYNSAMDLYNAGQYEQAISAFSNLSDYRDSNDKINEAKYGLATQLMNKNEYDRAIELFGEISDYEDSKEKIEQSKLMLASEYYANGNQKAGDDVLQGMASANNIDEITIKCAKILIDKRHYEQAILLSENIKDEAESEEIVISAKCGMASLYTDNGEFEKSRAIIDEIGGSIKNSESLKDAEIKCAIEYIKSEKYEDAKDMLLLADEYDDAKNLLDGLNTYMSVLDNFRNQNFKQVSSMIFTIPEDYLNIDENAQYFVSNFGKFDTRFSGFWMRERPYGNGSGYPVVYFVPLYKGGEFGYVCMDGLIDPKANKKINGYSKGYSSADVDYEWTMEHAEKASIDFYVKAGSIKMKNSSLFYSLSGDDLLLEDGMTKLVRITKSEAYCE